MSLRIQVTPSDYVAVDEISGAADPELYPYELVSTYDLFDKVEDGTMWPYAQGEDSEVTCARFIGEALNNLLVVTIGNFDIAFSATVYEVGTDYYWDYSLTADYIAAGLYFFLESNEAYFAGIPTATRVKIYRRRTL